MTGLAAALLLVWQVPAIRAVESRTVVVGSGAGAYPSIGAALQTARAGDTVRVEPGLYPERIFLPDGVSLVARVPSSVTLTRAAGVAGHWIAVTALGDLGGRLSGIRIESSPALPVDVGIRVAGQSRTIELIEMTGPMRTGIELLAGAAVTLHGSHFATQGVSLNAGERSEALVTRNVFLRAGRSSTAPVTIAPSADVTFRGNLFAGYGDELVRGASAAARQQILHTNVIVSADAPQAR